MIQLASGGLAGACSRTCTAPIDRARLLMQSGRVPGSLLDVFKTIVKQEGFASLWRGNGINVVKIVPESGARFAIFDYLKKCIAQDPTTITGGERFAAGGAAGAVSQALIYPLEIVRTRLALAPVGTYKGAMHCMTTVAKTEGIRHLYSGLRVSVIGIVPFAGIDLAVNSALRELATKQLAKRQDVHVPSVAVMLGCGMVSSTSAMLVTFPLGLIRTRLQVRPSLHFVML